MHVRLTLILSVSLVAPSACAPGSDGVDRFNDGGGGQITGTGGEQAATAAGGAPGTTSLHGGGASTGVGGSGNTTSASSGGGNVGSDACCSPSSSPGCPADSSLEQCVCASDSYCCNNEWDAICIWVAQNECQSCASAGCFDIGQEPNESESTAIPLAQEPVSDCNSAGSAFNGTISSPSDVDWYTYQGKDDWFCVVDPTRALQTLEGPLRMCKFAECHNGINNTEVTCPAGTTPAISPDGRSGCCGSSGFTLKLNCSGTWDDAAAIYIRLDQPGASPGVCNHYAVAWHY